MGLCGLPDGGRQWRPVIPPATKVLGRAPRHSLNSWHWLCWWGLSLESSTGYNAVESTLQSRHFLWGNRSLEGSLGSTWRLTTVTLAPIGWCITELTFPTSSFVFLVPDIGRRCFLSSKNSFLPSSRHWCCRTETVVAFSQLYHFVLPLCYIIPNLTFRHQLSRQNFH